MSKEQKLINKVKRRERFVREPKKNTYKSDKNQETLQASPRAQKLMRKPQRRMDASFGYDTVGAEPYLEYKCIAAALTRHDFGGSDFGLLLTLPAIAGNKAEVSKVTTVADTGDYEAFTLTATTGALSVQADYFTVEAPDGDVYAFWLDIDADGTEPTGAAYVASDVQVMVSILGLDTAIQVAGKIATAMAALDDVSVLNNANGTLTITYDLMGAHADATSHNAADSGAGSIGIVTNNQGADSNLNSAYWLLDTPTTDYYVWYNVASEGVDPLIPGRTGAQVGIAASALANSVASATQTVVNGLPTVSASVLSSVVTITDDQSGPVPDAADGAAPTGFTFQTSQQGGTSTAAYTEEIGVIAGDLVVIEQEASQVENRMLQVVEVIDTQTLRLDDVATFAGTENDVSIRFILSGVKKSYN